jgi:hypothetical protein
MPGLDTDVFLEHARQDAENFTAIRDSLENINGKLDTIGERTVRLETWHSVAEMAASKAGALSGSKWSAIVAMIVAGTFQACQLVAS